MSASVDARRRNLGTAPSGDIATEVLKVIRERTMVEMMCLHGAATERIRIIGDGHRLCRNA